MMIIKKILENDNLYQIILKDLDERSLKELNKIIYFSLYLKIGTIIVYIFHLNF
jgi:hypothetical protein